MSENNFYSHHLVQSNLMFFFYSEIMKTLLQLLIQFINYLVLHFSNIFADNIFYACVKACKLYCHYKKHLSDLFESTRKGINNCSTFSVTMPES